MTGDRRVNLFTRRLLSKTGLKEQLLDYLSNKDDDLISAMFQGQSGVVDADEITLSADGNDMFKLGLTNANRVIVGDGQVITIPSGASISEEVQFENSSGKTYYIGVKYAQVDVLAGINPKSGLPEYLAKEDSLGEVDHPTSVTDTPGVKIRLNINAITEANYDHSGRTVRVWLATPVSGSDDIAFWEGTSAFDGTNNYVDITYSGANGPLGQDTSSDPPSTTAADYWVFIEGVTWRRGSDLRTSSAYAFIGTVIGVGAGSPPSTFSTADQRRLFLQTLDAAYDGGSGGGAGRTIWPDAGAVELRRVGNSTDKNVTSLLINDLDSDDDCDIPMLIVMRGAASGFGILIARPMTGTGLQVAEPAEINGDGAHIDLTRGGASLTTGGVADNMDLVWMDGFADDDITSKLYIADVSSATQFSLRTLDGTPITGLTAAQTGTVTFLRAVFMNGVNGGLTVCGHNQSSSIAALKLYPFNSPSLAIYDDTATPVKMFEVTKDGALNLETADSAITGTGLSIKPGEVWATKVKGVTSLVPTLANDIEIAAVSGNAKVQNAAGTLKPIACAVDTDTDEALTSLAHIKACATLASPYSLPHNTEAEMPLDTEEYDVGGMWAVGLPSEMVCPAGYDGYYHFDFWVKYATDGSSDFKGYIALKKSPSEPYLAAQSWWHVGRTGTLYDYAHCACDVYLAATNYVHAVVFQYNGLGTAQSIALARFTAHRISR